METTSNSVKLKLGIKVMKLVEILIVWEGTVTGRGSECHLTFLKGRLHIKTKYPTELRFRNNSKRDFYLDVYTILNGIKFDMDHMRISAIEPKKRDSFS